MSPQPVYEQYALQLRALIEREVLKEGEFLPSEFELASQWGVSRPTVRRVISELANDGFLIRRHGIGTSVLSNARRRTPAYHGVFEELQLDGRNPKTEVIGFARIDLSKENAISLELPVSSEVVRIQRTRSIDGVPLAILSNLIPVDISEKISRTDLQEHGLYELLDRAGHKPFSGTQKIGARTGSISERKRLSLELDKAVLTIDRITRDMHGRVIDLGNHVYRAERYFVEMAIGKENGGEFL